MDKRNKFLLMALCTFALLLLAGVFLFYLEGAPLHCVETWLAQRVGTDLFSYYTAQLSLTFITISVMTVLSEKNVIIYWENIAESRLIKPTFGCFAAFSWYSIISNIGAAIGVFLRSCTVFTVFFATNILVLILLTNAIIDVYYGKDSKKKQLVKQLIRDYQSLGDGASVERYMEKIYGLQYRVRQLHRDENLLELQEIYKLYERAYPLFNVVLAKPFAEALADSLDLKTDDLFADMMTKVVADAEKRMDKMIQKVLPVGSTCMLSRTEIAADLVSRPSLAREENPCNDAVRYLEEENDPFQDREIWMALVHTEGLKRWISRVDIQHTRNYAYHDLERQIKRRFVSLYNYHVALDCMRKGCAEYIENVLLKWTRLDTIVWAKSGADVEPDLVEQLLDTAVEYMKLTVCEDDAMYVMCNVVRDFYAASEANENVGMYLGEYREFPIPEILLYWTAPMDAERMYKLMKRTPPVKEAVSAEAN